MDGNIIEYALNTIVENSSVHNSSALGHYIHSKMKRKCFTRSVLVQYLNKRVKKRKVPKNKDYIQQINKFPDDIFLSHFRMTRACFSKLLEELNVLWSKNAKGRPHIDAKRALYITLWALGNQNSYREISDRFDISMGMVYNTILKTCKILAKLAKKFIQWPENSQLSEISNDFENLRRPRGLPLVAGCVDGSHIRINSPSVDPVSYYNRKGYHSLLLQGICDSNLIFRDIFFGWPGSAHDANVWHNSPIGRALANGQVNLQDSYIIGDSAYPLLPYLITPYKDNGFLADRQRQFNYLHSTTRVLIEQSFGILKAKFRILNHLKVQKLSNAKFIVISCVVLHNFIRLNSNTLGISIVDILDLDQQEHSDIDEQVLQTQSGSTRRDVLCEWLFPLT